ncbi:uncharacterized protein L3040_004465 [Drepanopeziza brunnea f. sp. 'multigermtubi']|uniref:uncharacterized protein n=1 Tax=Drepanopeziza brunnea f. sp. 'multigermtubi' TaxID=698441 RepID=UPI00239978C8|nr:hypothetical protein L3040_004465 [Drepanopeziza brunnea f. sp. 'multigermtubi']
MANSVATFASRGAVVSIVFVAVLYQFLFKHFIYQTLGYGREVQSIDEFPDLKCENVDELGLEGCEDMWLHEKTGHLYMACSDSQSRTQWLPAVHHLNASGRGLTDRIAVLDTRGSGRLASRIKWLAIEDFSGINGDGTLNLHGLNIRADENTDTLHILLNNHRPPLDPVTGAFLDASKFGANSTIERFQTKVGSDKMRHVQTYTDPLIQTPNRVAWVSEDTFVFTNSHSAKVGFRQSLDVIIGGGAVIYCHRNRCHNASPDSKLKLPNGLVRGRDGLIYVPSSIDGTVAVFELTADHLLEKIRTIETGFPLDNLSVDKNGDLFAAAFPRLHIWLESSATPFDIKVPSTVLKIKRAGKGDQGAGSKGHPGHDAQYTVDKLLEDDGTVLSGLTIAVHDTQTGRLFMGGVMSPFITICEPRGK